MKTKQCRRCNLFKPATPEFFLKNKNTKSGLDGTCRDCHKARMRIANKEYYRRNRAKEMWRQYRDLDKRAGMHFDLTPEWFKQYIEDKPCFYCGTTDEPIGCDRIDNGLGHTKSNCVPCCKTCNKVRNNLFSVEEMRRIGAVIADIRRTRSAHLIATEIIGER